MIRLTKNAINFLIKFFRSLLDGDDYYLDVNTMNELVEENMLLKNKLENSLESFNKLQEENVELVKGLEIINDEIEKEKRECEEAEYWNNKWKKGNVTYRAREDSIYFDVRNFITAPDCVLKELIKTNNLKSDSYDDTAYKIMCWVQNNITYVTDDALFGFKEHWDFPAEVLNRKKSDCEGMSNLIVSLCINAGIPSYRIKNMCGNVKYKNGNNAGGHSWPIFLRESGDWIDLDPCFYNTKNGIEERIPVKDNKVYSTVWFAFNDVHTFTNVNLELRPGEEPHEI